MAKTKALEEKQDTQGSSVSLALSSKAVWVVPQNLEEAIRLSKLISDSDLAPKDFKGKPGNTLIAMQMGAEVGISPMASIQNIAVINGRPCLYGDMGKAILLSHGCRIEERDMQEIKKTGIAWCRVTRPDGAPATARTFSIDNAKDAGLWGKQGPWSTTPYRMLAWRAFWFAARDGAADMLKGLAGAEEVRDYIETSVETESNLGPIAEPRRASEADQAQDAEVQPTGETVDPETGEVISEPPEDNTEPLPAPDGFRRMESGFAGTCVTCKNKIAKGASIWYDKANKKAHHSEHFIDA